MLENVYALKKPPADSTLAVATGTRRERFALSNVTDKIVSFHRSPDQRMALEQMRTLRSRVCEIAATRGMQTILVTSTIPSEGKSLVAMNLAFSLNKLQHKRILLVDLDLRRPRIQEALRLPSRPDVCDFLSGAANFNEIGFEVAPGLDILPTQATENAPELLYGTALIEFLRLAKQQYDFVLMDSPPLAGIADSELLVQLADGVLYVVGADKAEAAVAADTVNRVRAKLIGAVLNRVQKLPRHAGYYYYYNEGE